MFQEDLFSFLEADGSEELAELERTARECRACGLRAGCRGVVFGEGNPRSVVMLVGEGPGAREDELGRPFVGRAGELLTRILEAAGFHREDVFITNIVMCRPPGNRVPADVEIMACIPYLHRKIALIRPAILICLGSTAARILIDPRARITQIRGRWYRKDDLLIMPTFHPAALLRDEKKKRPVWEDFKQVRDAHGLMEERGRAALASLEAETLAGGF